jgi:(1->4)-alpha-D-glucan 1-alpha-D-glucosylmutase
LKAAREAKEYTSWANTNSEYEGALSGFVHAILERGGKNLFLTDFEDFQRYTARIGWLNCLSQCLLKLTSPGVPDIYQGNEIWQFNLVDPDNRRPVDYEQRKNILEELPKSAAELLNRAGSDALHDGRAKLFLTAKTLGLRKMLPALFQKGSYFPLTPSGPMAEHVVAFGRECQGRSLIVAVPRLCAGLLNENLTIRAEEFWQDTALEIPASDATCYHNLFTGECIAAGRDVRNIAVTKLFHKFPVALLLSEPIAIDEGPCVGISDRGQLPS